VPRVTTRKRIIGFIALSIAMFIGILDSTIINIALPDITAYFQSTLDDTAWISTIYILALAVCMITASKLADQFGRKKLMLIGLALFGTSSALCGISHSLAVLIVMRLFQGIGGAIITPIVVPMGLELFGKEKMQIVGGSVGAITALAAAGGPPIGGLIIEYLDWQSVFFVNVPLALLSFVLVALFVGESYDRTVSKAVDWLGILLLTATLALLTFALLKGNDYGWNSVSIVSMLVGSAVALVLFILAEKRTQAPLLELGLFRELTFTASCACYLITGFGLACFGLIFSYFLQNALGYAALDAAYITMFSSLTVIVAMPLGSAIAGKFGARPINTLGLLIMGAGALLLSRLTIDASKAAMTVDMIVCGFGLGLACQAVISSIKHLPAEKSGIGSGVVNAARQVGTCIAIALLVSVLDASVTSAKADIQDDAVAMIQQSNIADPVKAVMVQDTEDGLAGGGTGGVQISDLQERLQTDIGNVMASSAQARPSIDLAEQQAEIQSVLDEVKADVNDKVAAAFDATFLLAGIILIATAFVGLFTDRKNKRFTPEAGRSLESIGLTPEPDPTSIA